MKIEVIKTIKVKEEIYIEFPHYYHYNVGGDDYSSDVYGKLEKDRYTKITVGHSFRHGTDTVEIEAGESNLHRLDSEVEAENKSSEAEFLAAKAKALKMLQGT